MTFRDLLRMNWLVPPILPYILYDTRLTPRWNPATVIPMYVELPSPTACSPRPRSSDRIGSAGDASAWYPPVHRFSRTKKHLISIGWRGLRGRAASSALAPLKGERAGCRARGWDSASAAGRGSRVARARLPFLALKAMRQSSSACPTCSTSRRGAEQFLDRALEAVLVLEAGRQLQGEQAVEIVGQDGHGERRNRP